MSTMIAVLGGVGLFLLGMSVMTSGLSVLRCVRDAARAVVERDDDGWPNWNTARARFAS